MNKETYHVMPNFNGGWSVTKRGNKRATRIFDSKENATKFAKIIVKTHSAELVIHKFDGSVEKQVKIKVPSVMIVSQKKGRK